MKSIVGIKKKYFLIGFLCSILIIFIGVSVNKQLLDNWAPDQDLVGSWTGTGQTREFGQLEEIQVEITISDRGIVTGSIGDGTLRDCVISLNRNAFERFLRLKTDYVISGGNIEGAISQEDALSSRRISLPFNLSEDGIAGSLFHVEGWSYPEPILVHLKLEKK